LTNDYYAQKELKYSAHNYSSLPIAITKGKGLYVWDVEGKKYYDFLAGYSSTNQGHCHPKIVKALCDQAKRLTQTSRAFFNDQLGETCEYLCNLVGKDKFLPMNTGVEATETAMKLARRWGYAVKGIEDNKARILIAKNSFHGRTITACGASDDPSRFY